MNLPNILVPTMFALIAAFPAGAQGQDQLRANLEQELAKDFVESGSWRLDFNDAKAEAGRENKLLFVYFTRTFAP